MSNRHVTVSDPEGQEREYVVITVREENGVTYAILSPEEINTDPNSYVAYGYEVLPGGERSYFSLPTDISRRLANEYRDEWEVDFAIFLAGDNLAVA